MLNTHTRVSPPRAAPVGSGAAGVDVELRKGIHPQGYWDMKNSVLVTSSTVGRSLTGKITGLGQYSTTGSCSAEGVNEALEKEYPIFLEKPNTIKGKNVHQKC